MAAWRQTEESGVIGVPTIWSLNFVYVRVSLFTLLYVNVFHLKGSSARQELVQVLL